MSINSLGGYAPAANEALRRLHEPQVVRVESGGITIDVRELNAFKNGVEWNDVPSLLQRATGEKAADHTVAYGDDIARHLEANGTDVFARAVERYNRDFSGPDLDPDIAIRSPEGAGRFATAIQAENQATVQAALDANPQLTGRILREMAVDAGYYGSPPHVAWAQAAEARTAGKVPAEFWMRFDPFGGTAGNGPNILPTGEHPGVLSKIAMAHDTDWSIGRYFGFGPMAALRGAEGFTPEQLGQVGLNWDVPWGRFAGIDSYSNGHPDWNVQY